MVCACGENSQLLKHFPLMLICITLRVTSKSQQTIAFKSNFVRSIFSQLPLQWTDTLDDMDIDVLNYNMVLLPFDAHDQMSLFVIVGAKYICDYTKIGFTKNRPCILHFDPCNNSRARHNHRQVADKLRTWLNQL